MKIKKFELDNNKKIVTIIIKIIIIIIEIIIIIMIKIIIIIIIIIMGTIRGTQSQTKVFNDSRLLL